MISCVFQFFGQASLNTSWYWYLKCYAYWWKKIVNMTLQPYFACSQSIFQIFLILWSSLRHPCDSSDFITLISVKKKLSEKFLFYEFSKKVFFCEFVLFCSSVRMFLDFLTQIFFWVDYVLGTLGASQ